MNLPDSQRRDVLFVGQLGGILVAWGLWYLDPSRSWALIIALAPIVAGMAIERVRPRMSPAAVPMIIFLATALVGSWAAYDRDGALAVFPAPAGQQKLWGLILGALLLHVWVQAGSRANMSHGLGVFAGLGALVAIWFMWTNDWSSPSGGWSLVARVGTAIQSVLPRIAARGLNANVTAGLIAPLLPLGLGLIRGRGASPSQRPLAIWGAITTSLMAAGMVLTLSGGGLLAVGCSLAIWGAWSLTRGRAGRRKRVLTTVAVLGCGLLALALLLVASPRLRAALAGNAQVRNRSAIYSEALLLMRDFPFTGSGLGGFALVHSTYALMIHVPILAHAHSMPLNITLEQGVLGSASALAILAIAGWSGLASLARSSQATARNSRAMPAHDMDSRQALWCGMLSLAALVIHGLVDDPLYSSRGLVLLWLPAGIILAAVRAGAPGNADAAHGSPRLRRRALLGMVLLSLMSLAVGGKGLAAAWHANMGAVSQARIELPQYDYSEFANPTLYTIRQQSDLTSAEDRYRRALALNPWQPTASTRLSAISFSRGHYEQAMAFAEIAMAHRGALAGDGADRVSRLVLGDALVSLGQLDRAVEAIRGLARAKDRLALQAWYKYWIGEDYERAILAWRAALMLDPSDEESMHWITEAEKRIRQP